MTHESARAVETVPPSPPISEGTWLVKMRGGILTWTLDELDLAFQRGQIDAATPVFTAGMTEWQTLGVVADLPAPSLADGGSFPPTSSAVLAPGAFEWTSIATPTADLQTGVRRSARVVPFRVRRGLGSVLDFLSNVMAHLRDVHPRWATVGPWLFGAGLSGIFVFALYQLANAPSRPGAHTRSGVAVSYEAASEAPHSSEPAAAAVPAPRAPTVSAPASASTTNAAETSSADSDVLRTRDLKFAPTRSQRQATASAEAKARAKAARRAKARAARKARRSQHAQALAE